MRRVAPLALIALVAIPAAGDAQTAPSAGPPAPAAPVDFNYEAGGRRDPFVDLLELGQPSATTKRGEGAAGLTVGEIAVSGVVQSRGLLIAMIQGPDRKTYVIHPGDKLADGVVTSVTSQGIIVLQDIQDQLAAPRKQREVTKLLRSFEGVRE